MQLEHCRKLLEKRGQEQARLQKELLEVCRRKQELEESTGLLLQRMQRQLEGAEQANADFLNGISHEFRNPLTTILGYSALLLRGGDGELNDEQRRCLQDIHDSGSRLFAMINDIIELRRFEAEQDPLSYAEPDALDLLRASLARVEVLASARGVLMATAAGEEGGRLFCEGDGAQLARAITILLEHAVKVSPPGGRIVVRLERRSGHEGAEGAGESLFFAVSDSGPPLPDSEFRNLFAPFRQIASFCGDSCESTGVGLALCRSIVHRHGGRIWAETAPGQEGNVFCFTIPVRKTGQHPLEQIIDPRTSLLTWESFHRHVHRLVSLCKRGGRRFGLVRFDLEKGGGSDDVSRLIAQLRTAHRDHEILACCPARRNCFYLILWDADRTTAGLAVSRLKRLAGDKPRLTHRRTLIYPEDGPGIDALLRRH